MENSIKSEWKERDQTRSISSHSNHSSSTDDEKTPTDMSHQDHDEDECASSSLTLSVYSVDGADDWCPTPAQRKFLKDNLVICGTWSKRSLKDRHEFIKLFNDLFPDNKATTEEIGDFCCGLGGLKIIAEEEGFMMVDKKTEHSYENMSAGFHEDYPMVLGEGGINDFGVDCDERYISYDVNTGESSGGYASISAEEEEDDEDCGC
jgi:hypothetical protein